MNVEPRCKFSNFDGVRNDLHLKGSNRIHHHSDVLAGSSVNALPRPRYSSPRRIQQRGSGEFPEECSGTPPWVKSLQQRQNSIDCLSSKSKRDKLKADHFFLPWSDEDLNGKINKTPNRVKIEPPGPFLGDAFSSCKANSSGSNKLLKSRPKNAIGEKSPGIAKKCTGKAGVSAKKVSADNKSKKQNISTHQWNENVPSEPFVVDWCRTSHLKASKLPIVEVESTSTTSATSRSKDLFETLNAPKLLTPTVFKNPPSNTGFVSPKMKAKRLSPTTKVTSETSNFFREYDFEVTHPDDAFSNRDAMAYENKSTNVNVGIFAATRKLSKSNTTFKDKGSTDKKGNAEPSKVTWTRENLVSPRKAKPRLSMTAMNPARKKPIDKKRVMKQVLGSFEKENGKVVRLVTENEKPNKWAEARDSVRSKKFFGKNTEPLDFSEFDTEDFSSEEGSGDFSDPSVLSMQPTLPLCCSSDNDAKSFFQSSDDMENFWSSPFAFK